MLKRLLQAALLLVAVGMVGATERLDTIITTVAGGGNEGMLGDGGSATSAWLHSPNDVAVDRLGNLYIADINNNRVRRVTPAGVISTVAGDGGGIARGDGGSALLEGVAPTGIDVDAAGNLYIADFVHSRVRKVSPAGTITTVAGDGSYAFSGDGGRAISAALSGPVDVAVDNAGNIFISDSLNYRIRKVDANGIISTVAGNGESGFSGDGGSALLAKISSPRSIAVDITGALFIADTANDRIRRVGADGLINTIAGGGPFGSDPVATQARLQAPNGVDVDDGGNVYIAQAGHVVQMVTRQGMIYVIAGTLLGGPDVIGKQGFQGDNLSADNAWLNTPAGLALDANGNVFFADSLNNRVRKLTPLALPENHTPGLNAFLPYVAWSAPGTTVDLVSGDVTGDGRDDVIYSTIASSSVDPAYDYKVAILVQRIDGTLSTPVFIPYPAQPTPSAIRLTGGALALADMDGDGVKDVLVSHGAGIQLVSGSRTGAFASRSFSGAFKDPTDQLVVMDVDRDGKPDVVATTIDHQPGLPVSPAAIAIYFGNGLGAAITRALVFTDWNNNLDELKAGDLTGDGLPDLAVTTSGIPPSGGYHWFAHDGVRGFLEMNGLKTAADFRGLAIGDFNGDGRKDMAVVQDRGGPDQTLHIYGEDKSQPFLLSLRGVQLYDRGVATAVGDLDANQHDDLVVLHAGVDGLGYYQQTSGSLSVEIKYALPDLNVDATPNVALGDVNHDGKLDAIVIGELGQLIVLSGTGERYKLRVNGSQPLLHNGSAGAHMAAADVTASGVITGSGASPSRLLERVRMTWAGWNSAHMLHRIIASVQHALGMGHPRIRVHAVDRLLFWREAVRQRPAPAATSVSPVLVADAAASHTQPSGGTIEAIRMPLRLACRRAM